MKWLTNELQEKQKLYRCTFVTKQLTEKAIGDDRRLHAAFIDQEKAFDRVNRKQLCEILAEY
jgi:hypothetical protein